jgi:hypothetical protein
VTEHVLPLGLEFWATRRSLDRGERRDGDPLVAALLLENLENNLGRTSNFGPTEDADDVVEVPWQAALDKSAEFLAEELREAVAGRFCPGWESIRIGMRHRAAHGLVDEYFLESAYSDAS